MKTVKLPIVCVVFLALTAGLAGCTSTQIQGPTPNPCKMTACTEPCPVIILEHFPSGCANERALNLTLKGCDHFIDYPEAPRKDLGLPSPFTPVGMTSQTMTLRVETLHCPRIPLPSSTLDGVDLGLVSVVVVDPNIGSPYGHHSAEYQLESYSNNPVVAALFHRFGFQYSNASIAASTTPATFAFSITAPNTKINVTSTATYQGVTLFDNLYRKYHADSREVTWLDLYASRETFSQIQTCLGTFQGSIVNTAFDGASTIPSTCEAQTLQEGFLTFGRTTTQG
jgi:hypothetical protein